MVFNRFIKIVVGCALFIFFSFESKAQSKQTDSTIVKPKPQVEQQKTLDTKESISYLGSKLMFQVKKRMNLTSEDEEKAEEKKSKKVALSFLGIKIEN